MQIRSRGLPSPASMSCQRNGPSFGGMGIAGAFFYAGKAFSAFPPGNAQAEAILRCVCVEPDKLGTWKPPILE